MTIDYIPIGVVNRNDNNPDSYLVNGVATEIIKDNSGLVANGTIFNPSTIGYIDEKLDETITEVNSNKGTTDTHVSDTTNPHDVNKTDVGLSLVDNINITSGTANPTGGSNGDIYFQYE